MAPLLAPFLAPFLALLPLDFACCLGAAALPRFLPASAVVRCFSVFRLAVRFVLAALGVLAALLPLPFAAARLIVVRFADPLAVAFFFPAVVLAGDLTRVAGADFALLRLAALAPVRVAVGFALVAAVESAGYEAEAK